MISIGTEKRLLQIGMAAACVVPLSAGFSGMIYGADMLDGGTMVMDSHFRYLSGLLFAIGAGFVSAIPHIELHARRVRLLTALVVVGGVGRCMGVVIMGMPNTSMMLALGMELIVTPALCLWQRRVASFYNH